MDMVEIVARAIRDAEEVAGECNSESTYISYLPAARAAIEAMREPSSAMANVGGDTQIEPCEYLWTQDIGSYAARECWGRMIDAGLYQPTNENLEIGSGIK